MRTKLCILPILLILASSLAFAADFSVDFQQELVSIYPSQVAEFDVIITNSLDVSDVLTFSVHDTEWVVLTSQVEVATGEKEFKFQVYPSPELITGAYYISVKIESSMTGESINKIVQVRLRPVDPVFGEYRPSIQFGADIQKEIDPRKKIPVEIYLRNKNALEIGEMTLVFDGTIFEGVQKTTLSGMEEKRIEYLFEVDPLQGPGLYMLDVQVQVKNITISQSTKSYEIIGYAVTSMESTAKNFLFKNVETIMLENTGNAEKIKQVNLVTPFTKRLFTNSEPEATVVKVEGQPTLQWDISVPSQSSAQIVVTTNYRAPIFILLLIILFIAAYYTFRSPLVVSKEVIMPAAVDDGVEHLKIRLFVKNRSRKAVDKVTVFDKIPAIADIEPKKILGTIQPDKVTRQDKKGTLVKWSLETLEAYEERIITYEMKSKLKIIGNITLPSTRVTFLDGNRERRTYSATIIVTN